MEIESPSSTGKSHFKLWSELELHEFPDKFVIRPVKSPGQGFSIARSDGTFRNLDGLFDCFFSIFKFLRLCMLDLVFYLCKIETLEELRACLILRRIAKLPGICPVSESSRLAYFL